MRAIGGQACTKEKGMSSLHFILRNHLSATNKQEIDQFSKGLFKKHLKNFNTVGFLL